MQKAIALSLLSGMFISLLLGLVPAPKIFVTGLFSPNRSIDYMQCQSTNSGEGVDGSDGGSVFVSEVFGLTADGKGVIIQETNYGLPFSWKTHQEIPSCNLEADSYSALAFIANSVIFGSMVFGAFYAKHKREF